MTAPEPVPISLHDEQLLPYSLDVNPTARCNLHCSFCWGPDHNIPDGLNTDDWKEVLVYCAKHGTRAVVFTGGEPLIRRDIGALVQWSKHLGLHVTLSTNGLMLRRKASEVLPYIDEIGIPLDGSTPARNAQMRLGTHRAFDAAIESLQLVHDRFPHLQVTVRTVVSRVNVDDVMNIGDLLASMSHLWHRWKLYQFAPVSIGAEHQDEHEICGELFWQVLTHAQRSWSPTRVSGFPLDQRVSRYLFVGPEGDVFGVNETGQYRVVGSQTDLVAGHLLGALDEIVDRRRNLQHGQADNVA